MIPKTMKQGVQVNGSDSDSERNFNVFNHEGLQPTIPSPLQESHSFYAGARVNKTASVDATFWERPDCKVDLSILLVVKDC